MKVTINSTMNVSKVESTKHGIFGFGWPCSTFWPILICYGLKLALPLLASIDPKTFGPILMSCVK